MVRCQGLREITQIISALLLGDEVRKKQLYYPQKLRRGGKGSLITTYVADWVPKKEREVWLKREQQKRG